MRLAGHQRVLAWATILVLALGYGWWAVSLPGFSRRATVAVLGAGAVAMLVGVASGRQRGPEDLTVGAGAGWWLVLAAVAGAWQLSAYLQEPRHEHPTLSSLANAVLDGQPARAGGFVLWIVAAILLARR